MDFLALKNLYWIIPLIVLAILAGYWAYQQRRRAIHLLTQGASECKLRSNASPLRRRILSISLVLAVILALVAALRPTGGSELSEHRRPAKNIVVLLDISRSMLVQDSDGVSRLDAAKLLLREFINSRPTDRIGLISFTSGTFPESPTTLDRTMLLDRINRIKVGDIPVGGTDLNRALESARNLLTEDPPPGSAIIMFSDGDNVVGRPPSLVLTQLSEANIPIISIGLGRDREVVNVPTTTLTTAANHSNLENLATATGGIFIKATPKEVDSQVAQISDRIDTIEIDGQEISGELYERPLELYAYPLGLALLFLLIHILLPLRTDQWFPLTSCLALSFILSQPLQGQEEDFSYPPYEAALAAAAEEEKPLMVQFTGSDWSPLSITFEKEILSHPVYQNWADKNVLTLQIDIPRVNLDPEERTRRRKLAALLEVERYPSIVFIAPSGEKLGSLTHDPDGPKSWTDRADKILAGESAEEKTPSSIADLPQSERDDLSDEELSPAERSVRFYNKALQIELADPEAATSKEGSQLLEDLYQSAAAEAPDDRPDLKFQALHKIALLSHKKARTLIPSSGQELQGMMRALRISDPRKILKRARTNLRKARGAYRDAAAFQPNDQSFSENLAFVERDLSLVEAFLKYITNYLAAIEKTGLALLQETRFLRSLEREVTTSQETNKADIAASETAIQDLVESAEAIAEAPTILAEDSLQDYRLALEDIILAPAPHEARNLSESRTHIENAYYHLFDPQQAGGGSGPPQQGQGDGEGSGENDEEEEGESGSEEDLEGGGRQEPLGDKPDDGDDGDDEGGNKDADASLKRSENEEGDLRSKLLNGFNRKGPRIPRNKDH